MKGEEYNALAEKVERKLERICDSFEWRVLRFDSAKWRCVYLSKPMDYLTLVAITKESYGDYGRGVFESAIHIESAKDDVVLDAIADSTVKAVSRALKWYLDYFKSKEGEE